MISLKFTIISRSRSQPLFNFFRQGSCGALWSEPGEMSPMEQTSQKRFKTPPDATQNFTWITWSLEDVNTFSLRNKMKNGDWLVQGKKYRKIPWSSWEHLAGFRLRFFPFLSTHWSTGWWLNPTPLKKIWARHPNWTETWNSRSKTPSS